MKIMTDNYRSLELFWESTGKNPYVILSGKSGKIKKEIRFFLSALYLSLK